MRAAPRQSGARDPARSRDDVSHCLPASLFRLELRSCGACRRRRPHLMLARSIGLALLLTTAALASAGHLSYPKATRGDVVTDYHGVKVPDPYRWMEDIDSPATRAWVEAEDKLSRDYLSSLPQRDAIARRLRQIWNFERWTAPVKRGQYWFYSH